MNIGMITPGMEVGCSIGIRLWMNHLGFVFFTLGGGKAPQVEKNKAIVMTLFENKSIIEKIDNYFKDIKKQNREFLKVDVVEG